MALNTLTVANCFTLLQNALNDDLPEVTSNSNVLLYDWINFINRRTYNLVSRLDPERYIEEQIIKIVSGTRDYTLNTDFNNIDAIGTGLFDVNEDILVGYKQYTRRQKGSSKIGFYISGKTTLSITPKPTATGQYLAYDAQSANFTEGLVVTGGTSGATGTIVTDRDDGTTGVLKLNNITGTFQDNEALTDSGSGSATTDGTLMNPRILRYIPILATLTATGDNTVFDESVSEYVKNALVAAYYAWREDPLEVTQDQRFIRSLDELLDNFREESYLYFSEDNSIFY